jgi:hypothetical protein
MFLTDHLFADEEKIEVADNVHLTVQRRTKQIEQQCQSRLEKVEINSCMSLHEQLKEQYHQQYF